jgi:hypothetical protein
LSGQHSKAPGFAGGYLLEAIVDGGTAVDGSIARLGAKRGIEADTGALKVINRETIQKINRIREAGAETGVMGMDSVFATYAHALRAKGHSTVGLAGSAQAARAMFNVVRHQPTRQLAMDAGQTKEMSDRVPGVAALKRR